VVGHPISIGANSCTICHNPHSTVASGCDGCHECPPATASHLKHFSGTVAQAGYGDTRIARDFSPNASGYIMNCGNCHPVNGAKHMNGTLEVELSSPLAPAGSIKAMNPASAAYVAGATVLTDSRGFKYTMGTCSNIYCHSTTDWTTPGGVPLVTDCLPESSSYWPQNLVVTKLYKTVTWGGGPLTCSGCHGNPPRTAYPVNDGGAGDSHSWIDNYGYDNLHSWNMGFDPVSCKYCHNDTVKQSNTYTRDAMDVTTLSDVPIGNYSRHVNGVSDVSFDKQNPFVYQSYGGTTSMSLANATYDASTKTCSNVACHISQTSVKWGTPYRWFDYSYECDRCHRMGICQ
jgi:predicted CxxxxCH...CXXCH cytochrome family protein